MQTNGPDYARRDLRRMREKAKRMRDAIAAMEGALCGATSLIDLPLAWGEPRHRPELGVKPAMTAGEIYGICDAFRELNAIVNDPQFAPSEFAD